MLAHPGIYRPSKHFMNANFLDPRNAHLRDFAVPSPDNNGMMFDESKRSFYDYVFKSLTEDAYNPITGEKIDGIVGYELLHTSNQGNPKKFEQMIEAGNRYGLYITAGSDSHGDYHPHAVLSKVVHQRTEQANVQDKNEKLSHFAVVSCKFVEDLKRSVQTGVRLTRNPANKADDQMQILKTDNGREEYMSLGQFRQIAREAAAQSGNEYNGGGYNGGRNGGKKGGKKHGHRHLEPEEENVLI